MTPVKQQLNNRYTTTVKQQLNDTSKTTVKRHQLNIS